MSEVRPNTSDAGKDRTMASNPQEPHPTRELLTAERSQRQHRAVRQQLQILPIPRKSQQLNTC